MFGGFWTTLLLVPPILGLLASPLFYIARKRNRDDTIKRFAIAGAVVTLFVAALAFASDLNVQQCIDAGNPSCVDAGTSGMQLVIMGGYVLAAWWVAKVVSDQ